MGSDDPPRGFDADEARGLAGKLIAVMLDHVPAERQAEARAAAFLRLDLLEAQLGGGEPGLSGDEAQTAIREMLALVLASYRD